MEILGYEVSKKKLAVGAIILWLSGIFVLILDGLGYLGSDIGFVESLQTSSLARGMFTDIGLLSTVISIWILQSTEWIGKYFFAIFVLFVGGFGFLPYLAIYFWFDLSQK
jgi:hypothetical protein